jgi:hypothetical protein
VGRRVGRPTDADGSSALRRAPQNEQNLEPGGLLCPHAPQRTGTAAPQELQNRLLSAISAEQLGHCMTTPLSSRSKGVRANSTTDISRPEPTPTEGQMTGANSLVRCRGEMVFTRICRGDHQYLVANQEDLVGEREFRNGTP